MKPKEEILLKYEVQPYDLGMHLDGVKQAMGEYAKQYAKGELEFLFQSLLENLPLYKDSGLWQLRTDNMKKVLIQQNMNMSNIEFIKSINRAQKTWL